MHKKIKDIYVKISTSYKEDLSIDNLIKHLFEEGVTKTEAWLVLYQGYGIDKEDANSRVEDSELWNDEDYLETMYQVAYYLKDDFGKDNND